MIRLARDTRLAIAASRAIDYLAALFNLAIRFFIAQIFFKAGLVKIQSWDTTLALFENEYAVPLLPPQLAAWMGTAGELVLPVLLVLGLGGRIAALGLFIVNAVAVISYADVGDLGMKDHVLWGWLLAVIVFHGAGKFSVDAWLRHRHAAGVPPARARHD